MQPLHITLPHLLEEWLIKFEKMGGCYIFFSSEQLATTKRYFLSTCGHVGTELARSIEHILSLTSSYSDSTWVLSPTLSDEKLTWSTITIDDRPHLLRVDDGDSFSEPDEPAPHLPPVNHEVELRYLLSMGEGCRDIGLCIQIITLARCMLDG